MKKLAKAALKKSIRLPRRWGIVAACAVLLIVLAGSWGFVQSRGTNGQPASKTSDPSEGGKYLVIKEWGVRFELPEELRGDIYYETFRPDESEQKIFYSLKLAKPPYNCTKAPKTTGVYLIRFTDSSGFPDEIGRQYQDGLLTHGDMHEIGGYQYSISTGYHVDICFRDQPNENDLVWPTSRHIQLELNKAVLELQPIPQ